MENFFKSLTYGLLGIKSETLKTQIDDVNTTHFIELVDNRWVMKKLLRNETFKLSYLIQKKN